MNHDLDIDTQDLDWIAGQSPQRIGDDPFLASDPFARERALQALNRHIGPRRARRGSGLRPALGLRTLGFAAAAGAVALLAVAVLSSGGGDGGSVSPEGAAGVAPAASSAAHGGPLMRLADYVSESPAPTGNATLVQRTTTAGGKTETVFDLYGDSGRYVFSPTKAGLAEVIEGRPEALAAGEDGDGGTVARELAAAEEANSGNVQAAAEDMAKAPMPSYPYSPGDPEFANRVWVWSQDALIAGSGKPQIRAGVLKILGTLKGVSVTEGVAAGTPTLVLTAGSPETHAAYDEQLTIDARTGVPIKFVGGPTGGPPLTEVEYQVSRADYAGLGSTAAAE